MPLSLTLHARSVRLLPIPAATTVVRSPFILSKPPTGGSNGGVCLWPSVVLAAGAALEKYVRSGHFSVQKPTMAFHFLSRSQSTYNNFSVSCLISSGPSCPTPLPFKLFLRAPWPPAAPTHSRPDLAVGRGHWLSPLSAKNALLSYQGG